MVDDDLADLWIILDGDLQHPLRLGDPIQRAQLHRHRHPQMREIGPPVGGKLVNRQRGLGAFKLAHGLSEIENVQGFLWLDLRQMPRQHLDHLPIAEGAGDFEPHLQDGGRGFVLWGDALQLIPSILRHAEAEESLRGMKDGIGRVEGEGHGRINRQRGQGRARPIGRIDLLTQGRFL